MGLHSAAAAARSHITALAEMAVQGRVGVRVKAASDLHPAMVQEMMHCGICCQCFLQQ